MKADIDRLMQERGLVALIVTGDDSYNAPRDYLTNGAQVTGGLVVKRAGEAPIMVVNGMETEEAGKSGLKVHSYQDFDYAQLAEQHKGDPAALTVAFWGKVLEKLAIPHGKVGLYGVGEIHYYLELVRLLREAHPQYEIVGDIGLTLFDAAYVTKDSDELKRLRSVAARTSDVLRATWDYIASCSTQGDGTKESLPVLKHDGTPLTVGDVKAFVRRALLDRGLEDTHMIFAPGRDGGFPHSRGDDPTPLYTGQAIVFDLFPREAGGGYHHDCTRTWSIGFATDDVRQAFGEVQDAFDVALDSFRLNMPAAALQEAAQSYLEGKGHPTARSHPGTNVGYVHSLGHGMGLKIHERPSISHLSKDTLTAGNILTIEPGVYYPDKGYGVRIEDTVYVHENGELETLTDFHKELVLPLRGNGR